MGTKILTGNNMDKLKEINDSTGDNPLFSEVEDG